MYSNRLSAASIHHVIPCGVLTEISFKWGREAITILSAYRPVINPEPGSLRSIVESLTNSDLELNFWNLISDYSDKSSVLLCGDLNLSPRQLDKKITDLGLFAKRIPFTGDHYSFRRWDSIHNTLQRSSIDHLIWNGEKIPTCSLTQDGFFALDHIPVIVDTKLLAPSHYSKITKFKRNPTLKFSDKGACRKFLNLTTRHADQILAGTCPPQSLSDLTTHSVDIVKSIYKRRNNARTPSLWSPIAAFLALRCSALGSTIRLGQSYPSERNHHQHRSG